MPLKECEFNVSLDGGLAVMSENGSFMCFWDCGAWSHLCVAQVFLLFENIQREEPSHTYPLEEPTKCF